MGGVERVVGWTRRSGNVRARCISFQGLKHSTGSQCKALSSQDYLLKAADGNCNVFPFHWSRACQNHPDCSASCLAAFQANLDSLILRWASCAHLILSLWGIKAARLMPAGSPHLRLSRSPLWPSRAEVPAKIRTQTVQLKHICLTSVVSNQ